MAMRDLYEHLKGRRQKLIEDIAKNEIGDSNMQSMIGDLKSKEGFNSDTIIQLAKHRAEIAETIYVLRISLRDVECMIQVAEKEGV